MANIGKHIQIGGYGWTVIAEFGDQILVIADDVLFTGHYNGKDCRFEDSILSRRLRGPLTALLTENGADPDAFSIGMPTRLYYEQYVKGVAENCSSAYLLLTYCDESRETMFAVTPSGTLIAVGISERIGIRPTMFITRAFFEELVPPEPAEDAAAEDGKTLNDPAAEEPVSEAVRDIMVQEGDACGEAEADQTEKAPPSPSEPKERTRAAENAPQQSTATAQYQTQDDAWPPSCGSSPQPTGTESVPAAVEKEAPGEREKGTSETNLPSERGEDLSAKIYERITTVQTRWNSGS